MVKERIVLKNTNDMYSFNNGLHYGKKQGAIEMLDWILSKKAPKPLKIVTSTNEEVILIYEKWVQDKLKELEGNKL